MYLTPPPVFSIVVPNSLDLITFSAAALSVSMTALGVPAVTKVPAQLSRPGGQPYEKNRATTNTPIIVNASAILSAAPKTSPIVAPTPARAAA